MVPLSQGQSDPSMPGRRRANLKYQSPVDISGVRIKCISKVIGWFRIGSCNVTYSEEEALDGSRAIVLIESESASGTLTMSACPSFVLVSASGFAVIPCCIGLSASGMSSVLS